jgi:hypothetical protein
LGVLFLGEGSSKTKTPQIVVWHKLVIDHKNIFCKNFKKSMSKTSPQKSTQKSMSVFPRFFLPLAFGCFLAMGVQKHYKKRCTKYKKSCQKAFTKKSKIDKKIQNRFFFLRFCLLRFWAFLSFSARGEGGSKTRQKISKKYLTLVLFWPLTHPPTTGVTDFLKRG